MASNSNSCMLSAGGELCGGHQNWQWHATWEWLLCPGWQWQKEVAAGQLHALTVQGIPLTRSLRCVANPARYQSRLSGLSLTSCLTPLPVALQMCPLPSKNRFGTSVPCCFPSMVLTTILSCLLEAQEELKCVSLP